LNIKHIISFCCVIAATAIYASEPDDGLAQFEQVYTLLRTNLQGAKAAQLDRAAIKGLLNQFPSKVMLVREGGSEAQTAADAPLGKTAVFDNSYAYFRVLKVETNLAGELMASYRDMAATNKSKIKGVVLDLRFAGGTDFAAAAAAADCFLNADQPLLEFGGVTARSTKKDNAITVPLAALINSKTSEAAEGLAAVLRQTSTGLLLGTESAGRASLFKDFPLNEGGKLRIAVGEIKLGDGTVFRGGIKPDIVVKTNPEDEKAYWEHPWQVPGEVGKTNAAGTNLAASPSQTNGGAFRRFSEAELVREQRIPYLEGGNIDTVFLLRKKR